MPDTSPTVETIPIGRSALRTLTVIGPPGGLARAIYGGRMSAYLVVHVRISDRAWLRSEYTSLMPSLMARHGGEYLARGGHQQVEGTGLGDITAIIRFPTMAAAQAFWDDPEYQRIAPLRRAGSEADVILMDGIDR